MQIFSSLSPKTSPIYHLSQHTMDSSGPKTHLLPLLWVLEHLTNSLTAKHLARFPDPLASRWVGEHGYQPLHQGRCSNIYSFQHLTIHSYLHCRPVKYEALFEIKIYSVCSHIHSKFTMTGHLLVGVSIALSKECETVRILKSQKSPLQHSFTPLLLPPAPGF